MKLIMTKGVPGAGKTTWALAQCAADPNTVRINKDDLRFELFGIRKGDNAEKYRKVQAETEKRIILPERDRCIIEALQHGKSVIVDDTNLAPKHYKRLRELAAMHGAEFEVKDFDTSLEECIKRNAARPDGDRVPQHVIYSMWKQQHGKLPEPTFAPWEPTAGLPLAIICDLDGTAAILDKAKRSPYDASRCDELDEPNRPVLRVVEAMVYENYVDDVIYLSGRSDRYRKPTERFLDKHVFPIGALHMRADGDNRTDWVVKGELFDAHIRGKYNVVFVLDDRDQVVNFWRSIGLTCWQVAPGAF